MDDKALQRPSWEETEIGTCFGQWRKSDCYKVAKNLAEQHSSVLWKTESSVQFSSVAQSCQTICDTMNRSMPGLPVHYQLLEFTQTHVH